MKLRIMLKLVMLSVFTTLTLISCNYILEDNNDENEVLSKAQTRINIHKQEAKLLLKASRANLDILELCEVIKYVDTQNSVRDLTKRIEKTHFEISKNYNELADEKLISIPNSIIVNNEFDELINVASDTFIEHNLKIILNKTAAQIELLDTLGNTTENIEFKILAIKNKPTLKSNMNKIVMTLNKFNHHIDRIKY